MESARLEAGQAGRNYSRIQQESASAFFQDVAVAVVEGDAQSAEDATQQLLDEHSGTRLSL